MCGRELYYGRADKVVRNNQNFIQWLINEIGNKTRVAANLATGLGVLLSFVSENS
jgi:hypothetical protein